ncbi:aldo/keto reductase [Mumia zhuanghuii]|uniref:Aldo/keto reductase n=2 Tax=Mumia TaxID=1546255 RepID=A0ABW1QMT7_9ACTN|nr:MULTISPECIES: aldo/keto reductase [Mumia]KAA1419829.1 aldo/keto reductase [Mumia zhuanghuii]
MTIPTVTLNDGVTMPQIGFGVFQVPGAETTAAVSSALEAGYRSIDTAAAYRNETGVGQALAQSGLARDDLFVTTKLWNTDQGRDNARPALEASLERLGLDRVDLYLIHWPAPGRGLFAETWEAFEELRASGLTRSIGVSNFLPEHLDAIIALGGPVPAVNQIEVHPELQQRSVQDAGALHGIVTEAWSPLAQAGVLGDPVVAEIAAAHGRTPAQVVLRWHLEQGRVVIPKSVTPSRIAENLAITDFTLTSDEVTRIDGLEAGRRTGPDPATFNG